MAPLTEKGLSDWRVETLRLTIFATAMPDVSGIDWWEAVVGESPELKTLQPRAGMLQEVGQIKGGLCNLSLECQRQRIDWLFSPILKENQELTEFPTFANLPDGQKLFQAMLLPWLSRCPPANRIAFGAVLACPVESRTAGYELLGKYLRSVRLDRGSDRAQPGRGRCPRGKHRGDR